MPLREVCNTEVVTVAPETDVRQAAHMMREFHVGDLVVVEKVNGHRKPIGMITDRDIVSLVVANGVSAESVTVEDVMMRHPVTVTVHEGVYQTLSRMRERGVQRLPVVDDNGNLYGIVSANDLLMLLAKELMALATISEKQIENEREGMTLSSERFA